MFSHIEFAYPYFFLLLLALPFIVWWYVKKHRTQIADIQLSTLQGFDKAPRSLRERAKHVPFILRMMVCVLLVTILARPQSSSSWQDVTTEGIDIVLAMDISGSMLAEDFKPNRIEAAKKVATEFIDKRPTDRIGLVVFAGESFTQCPITTDHSVIKNMFGGIKSGMLEDGTAIGMGLATSVQRLKESEAKSKVVILLTDGVNNRGSVAPLTAAEIAETFGIRVYTVGIGTKGMAPYPAKNAFGMTQYQQIEVQIDEDLLKEISTMTDGKYFRATDNKSLQAVYEEIDQLEKSKIDVTEYRKKKEEFLPFGIAALLLLLVELLLRNTVLRTIP